METARLLAFSDNRAEDVREFLRFLKELVTFDCQLVRSFQKPEPVSALLRFFSRNLDSKNKVLLAQRFVGFDVVCANGTGGTNRLSRIFNVCDCFWKVLDKSAARFGEIKRAVFEIKAFWIFILGIR